EEPPFRDVHPCQILLEFGGDQSGQQGDLTAQGLRAEGVADPGPVHLLQAMVYDVSELIGGQDFFDFLHLIYSENIALMEAYGVADVIGQGSWREPIEGKLP